MRLRSGRSKMRKAKTSRNFNYPENTAGSKAAKKLRSETNKLSESERERLFRRGMQIIYGGKGARETVRSR